MLHSRKLGEDGVSLFIDAGARIEQHADQIGVMRPAPCRRNHGAIEPSFRQENPRGIDQNNLRVVLDDDAADQRARGLHLARDDGDLGADQRIDQRRLADIGRADQRDEAAARRHRRDVGNVVLHYLTPSRAIIADAATFSAARLLPPTPSAGASPGNSTAMRNCGS